MKTDKKKTTSAAKLAYLATLHTLFRKREIFLPFIIFVLVELFCLLVIFLMPRQPFVTFFGPPIRTFWGERFLHYPFNFLLMPKLASLSRMMLSVFLGSVITGAVVMAVSDIYHEKPLKIKASFRASFKKYFSLFAFVLLINIFFYFSVKACTYLFSRYFSHHSTFLFIKARIWMGPVLIALNFLMLVLLQSLVAYVIPGIMISAKKLSVAIIFSVRFFLRNAITTLVLVGIPMLLYLPLIVANSNSWFLINTIFPESILLLGICSALIGSLVVDPFITLSTTYLYLISGSEEEGAKTK